MRTVEIEVFGKVQGVFFRASVLNEAKKLGLAGWVKNLPNGNVLIECQGEEALVDQLVDFCKSGPEHAVVSGLRVRMIQEKTYGSFSIK